MSNVIFNFNFGASQTPQLLVNKNYSTITQYISDIRNVEDNDVSAEIAANTDVMVTKCRKIYYNSTGWNEILVPGTQTITALPDNSLEHAKSHQIALPAGKNADNETLYLEYDIAHIFAILDAANHNGTVSPLSLLGADFLAKLPHSLKDIVPVVHDRLMACGWLGDLSEIVGEFYLQKAATTEAKQNIINLFGVYYKNLANVDGMVMVDKYKDTLSSTDGERLSVLLTNYYGAEGDSGERSKLQSTRYKTFARMIGLTYDKAEFTNIKSWVEEQKVNLRTCAAFYIANKCLDKSESVKKDLAIVLKADLDAAFLHDSLLSELEKQFALLLKDEITHTTNGLEDDLLTLTICFLMWIGIFDEHLAIDSVLYSFAGGLADAIKETEVTTDLVK